MRPDESAARTTRSKAVDTRFRNSQPRRPAYGSSRGKRAQVRARAGMALDAAEGRGGDGIPREDEQA
jgi:hypothetical protein